MRNLAICMLIMLGVCQESVFAMQCRGGRCWKGQASRNGTPHPDQQAYKNTRITFAALERFAGIDTSHDIKHGTIQAPTKADQATLNTLRSKLNAALSITPIDPNNVTAIKLDIAQLDAFKPARWPRAQDYTNLLDALIANPNGAPILPPRNNQIPSAQASPSQAQPHCPRRGMRGHGHHGAWRRFQGTQPGAQAQAGHPGHHTGWRHLPELNNAQRALIGLRAAHGIPTNIIEVIELQAGSASRTPQDSQRLIALRESLNDLLSRASSLSSAEIATLKKNLSELTTLQPTDWPKRQHYDELIAITGPQ